MSRLPIFSRTTSEAACVEIITYSDAYWPQVRVFLNEHWRAGHPYTHAELFNWQFAGFGAGRRAASKLVVRDGEVVGMLGGIPGEYFVDGQVRPGVVYDLWVVRPDLRNGALGLMLMRALEDEFAVTCCLGVNLNVVRYYTARGYQYCPALHRYVAPLEPAGLERLLAAGGVAVGAADRDAFRAARETAVEGAAAGRPAEGVDAEAAQRLYESTVEKVLRFGVHRTAGFWTWRYLQSAGFRYSFFGEPDGAGLIVARIERAISPEQREFDGMPVLRLIELLPAARECWEGAVDAGFARLLRGVLAWGAQAGCLLADYQLSSDRLGPLLESTGFTDVSAGGTGLAGVPNLFQPLRFNAAPINYVWRLAGEAASGSPPQPRDIYFVKSDDGMDRPNVWPVANE